MEYTDQTSGSIRFFLGEGAFDLNQFMVLKREQRIFGEFTIEFGILGESHFVRFQHGEEVLNEICACTDIRIKNQAQLHEYDFLPNLRTIPVSSKFLIFPYTFDFTYMNWTEGTKRLELLRKKRDNRNTAHLAYIFPNAPDAEPSEQPVTEIYVEFGTTICIYSVHTYPNEELMVFTESTLRTD